MTHPTHRHLTWLALLLGLVVIALVLAALFPAPAKVTTPTGYTPPAPTPTAQDVVTAQHGFQYLVSHTTDGFSPTSLSITKGETVRFSNSAPSPLLLTFSDAASQTVVPGGYYEYTYLSLGSFTYSDGTASGIVTVN
jgi:plastocyanin